MAERDAEPVEIRAEDLPEESAAAPEQPARLVIEAEDLPSDEELAAQAAEGRAFPGFEGPAPVAGLHVLAHCASRKGEFVVALSPRKEGGYWLRVAPGKSAAGVGRGLTVGGPFVYGPDFACPHCRAHHLVVCECGALFCHEDKPTAVCPACQRKLRMAGLASQVEAFGGGKGG